MLFSKDQIPVQSNIFLLTLNLMKSKQKFESGAIDKVRHWTSPPPFVTFSGAPNKYNATKARPPIIKFKKINKLRKKSK